MSSTRNLEETFKNSERFYENRKEKIKIFENFNHM